MNQVGLIQLSDDVLSKLLSMYYLRRRRSQSQIDHQFVQMIEGVLFRRSFTEECTSED